MKRWKKTLRKHQYTIYATFGISILTLLAVILLLVVPAYLKKQDITAPVITLNGETSMLIAFGSTFEDPGFTATDDMDGNLTKAVKTQGTINTSLYGPQILTYSVSDGNGNETTVTRTVIVQEFVPPILTLIGNEVIYVPTNTTYIDPGFSAVDDTDGDITDRVVLSDTVDFHTPGTYTLTYTATDSSGNSVSQSRTLKVFTPQSEEQTANPPDKVVYLTFDDGPGPYTKKLLGLLDKFNVDVTFFVTGQYKDYYDQIGAAYQQGHTIALHTYSHNFSEVYDNESAYFKDLNKISAICEAQTGVKSMLVRFPGGTSNTASKKFCAGIMTALTKSLPAKGYQYCDWNVDSLDAGGAKNAQEVAANVIDGIQKHSKSYVLMHDIKSYTVDAIEEIIFWGLTNGYTFLPLTEDSPMSHHRPNN